jgi:hypothetical protein
LNFLSGAKMKSEVFQLSKLRNSANSAVWMTDWGVAGEISNRVGYRMVYSIRGDDRLLIDAPAHLLQAF